MRILKVYNNNIVSVRMHGGREALLTGAGIGFNKKNGQRVDKNRIEKYYFLEDEIKEQFHELINSTPSIYLEISIEILNKAKHDLEQEVDDTLLIGLTDHIYNSVERLKEGFSMTNLILNETKTMYFKEYQVSLWAIEYINKMLNINLPEDEAGYITIHIVNAMDKSKDANNLLCFVDDILNLISTEMEISYKKESLDYQRIIIHLKFFYRRIMYNEYLEINESDELYNLIINKNVKIKKCVHKINEYLIKEYNYQCTHSEQLYLMLHILKILC
jgi:beta-glucoside operon transcriptional antiterminator